MAGKQFVIMAIKQTDGGIVMQAQDQDGNRREFGMAVQVSTATPPELYVFRHYVDPESVAAFPGSEPWGKENGDGEEG
jgi:hypothetical protein